MANVITPYFRASYPNVFKPRKNELNGQDEFSVVAIFPKGTDMSGMKKAAHEAIVKKWGPDSKKWPSNLRSPFRSHSEKVKEDEATGQKIYPPGMEEGGIFINLRSKQKPGVVDQAKKDITIESDFYSGCWARAAVTVYAYDTKGNRGVSFGLVNLQKYKDGEPLGSRTRAQDDFAPIDMPAGADSSTADATSLFG